MCPVGVLDALFASLAHGLRGVTTAELPTIITNDICHVGGSGAWGSLLAMLPLSRHKTSINFAAVALFNLTAAFCGCDHSHSQSDSHSHSHQHSNSASSVANTPAAVSSAQNPVQQEMQLLTSAMQSAVRAIGQGDVRSVEHDLHRIHMAKESTENALKTGAYTLPKNHENRKLFEQLDDAFHKQLEQMFAASQKNDVPAMATAVGNALQACPNCHTMFRP